MSDCSSQAMKPKQQRSCGTCCRTGTFRCEVPVLYPLGGNRLIYVDRCLVPELQSLWLRGISTAGCCCGHFEKPGFVQVFPEHEGAMHELGYEPVPPYESPEGELLGVGCFKPKTNIRFGGYIDVKSELEENCERLTQVAREMLETMQDWYQLLDAEDAPNPCYLASIEEKLEALGVSADEM